VLCLVNLSLDEASEATLVAAGALTPLVGILRTGSQVLQEQVRRARSSRASHCARARAHTDIGHKTRRLAAVRRVP